MKVTIEIDCEDERELYIHLSVIRSQLKKEFKKDPDFVGGVEDSNCYGYHYAEVQEPEHVGQYLIIEKP